MAATSSLPPQPAAASGAAVDAAAADVNAKEGAASSSGEAAAETGASSSSTGGGGNNASEIRTVFTDPENFNAKHPLYHNWTLWFDNPSAKGMTKAAGGKDSWGEEMKRVVDFDSVEEFWGLYNNVIPPSMLPQRANYYLFKEGVKPAWEDPANADGGKWAVQMPRDKSRESIDKLWLFTMLSAIGETLEAPQPGDGPDVAPELVTGVILSARPQFYRVAIWTRKAEDPVKEAPDGSVGRRLLEIGKHFKTSILGYSLNQRVGTAGNLSSDVEFQSHTESEKKRGKRFTI